jgi:hypothetical protein
MCSLRFSRNFGAAPTCFLTFRTRMSKRWELNTNWPPVTTSAPPFARKMSSSNGSTFVVVGARARASAARVARLPALRCRASTAPAAPRAGTTAAAGADAVSGATSVSAVRCTARA